VAVDWLRVPGTVARGHGVASGQGAGTPYPRGSLAMQKPFFARLGLNLDGLYEGTLNLSIAPRRWRLVRPAHTFERLEWTHLHPPETFSFSRCRIQFTGRLHEGWVYYPSPQTKAAHFHNDTIVEVLMPWIDGLAPGGQLMLDLSAQECELVGTAE
jgi:hypothetical protein